MNKLEALQQCTVDGTTIKLPNVTLDRKVYLEVKTALELIGGKWKGGKVGGFVFATDPTELLQKVAGGEKVNPKKEFQFFGTPAELAKKMVAMADISPTSVILEPSAGQGAIVDEILKVTTDGNMVCICEKMPINRDILMKKYDGKVEFLRVEDDDFLNHPDEVKYDSIIANPPFSKNQDIEHIQKMYTLLQEGGTLVAISSTHWEHSQNNKERAFKQWLDVVGAYQEDIPAGAFKESGTSIATKLIMIQK